MTSASVRSPRAISYSTASFHSGVLRPASWRSISAQVVKGTRVSLRDSTGSTGDKSFDGANRESSVQFGDRLLAHELRRLHLHQLFARGFMHQDGIGGHQRRQLLRQFVALAAHPEQGFETSPNMETVKPSTSMHLHHAAAGGDGAHEVTLLARCAA